VQNYAAIWGNGGMNRQNIKKPTTLRGKGISYIIISGIGWMLGLIVFYVGVCLQLPPFLASIICDLVGITFAFFASAKKTFNNNGKSISIKFVIYLLYMIVVIGLVSFLVTKMYDWGTLIIVCNNLFIEPGIAVKVLITPVTLTCNFFVTLLIFEGNFSTTHQHSKKRIL
jgi:putative flippase GtrA